MSRKQQLLKRHRRNKRIGVLIGLVLLVVIGVCVAWWLPLVLGVLAWVAHEAWFADHLFYAPSEDYQYRFAADAEVAGVRLEGGRLQVDSPLQKRLRGTGLGLSLCKRFAVLLGGHVGVNSVPGEGSEFFVVVPLNLQSAAEALDAAP